MIIDEILKGESKNIEFKETLPERSNTYMKTIVAFANGQGGKLIFGIEDKTLKVVGIDTSDIFKTMDSIVNAISDSCYPAIIPDVTLQTIEDKTVIVAEISVGKQRPYYIKSLGLEKGVYIRIGATTRPAEGYMIKELMFEGSNFCFDKAACLGLKVSEDDINALCTSLKETAVRNCHSEAEKLAVKDVTENQLLSWGILMERDGEIVPTNAYALLTGNIILPTAIQCGVFKGTTKAVFVDRREFTGPIQKQVEEAYDFVLRNIHLGAKIVGVYRHDIYMKYL